MSQEPLETELESKNPMEEIRLEKLILHISAGNDWERLQKAARLLNNLTNQKVAFRRAKSTIRTFGISRGDIISCMVTLRGLRAEEFLKKAFLAVDNKVRASSFDSRGNFAFGIKEHLDLPDTRYDPEIGTFGMDVIVSLERPGYRVKKRRFRRTNIGKKALIDPEESMSFVEERFGVEVVEAA
ncbi:MAG: 50S ribosomal protein L5 [Nitrososphaeria archaeon]|nr:50S ribosomal protein L5 [Nitrososphaeria archaeon]